MKIDIDDDIGGLVVRVNKGEGIRMTNANISADLIYKGGIPLDEYGDRMVYAFLAVNGNKKPQLFYKNEMQFMEGLSEYLNGELSITCKGSDNKVKLTIRAPDYIEILRANYKVNPPEILTGRRN